LRGCDLPCADTRQAGINLAIARALSMFIGAQIFDGSPQERRTKITVRDTGVCRLILSLFDAGSGALPGHTEQRSPLPQCGRTPDGSCPPGTTATFIKSLKTLVSPDGIEPSTL